VTEIEELAETLRALAAAFDQLGVRWAVGGSLASSAYGEPRTTNDVDVIADLEPHSARALALTLMPRFYADAESAERAARDGSSFNAIDERSFIKVDVFAPRAGRLGLDQLNRRRTMEVLPGVEVPLLGPEDVVLQKLRWYRLGGSVSDRQWRDVVSVLRHTRVDDAYLDEVAGGTDLAPLLDDARQQAREP
jgi:hypothetical protein